MSNTGVGIEQHPDVGELRARFDRVSETPTAYLVEGVLLLAGTYLAASSWIVGFPSFENDLRMNNLICGLAVAVLAFGFATAYGRTHGLSWVPVVLGVWTMISPVVIQGTHVTTGAVVSNIICGLLITVLGLVTLAIAARRERQTTRSRAER